MKQAGVDPALVPAVFDVVRTVGFVELWGGHKARTLRRGRILTCAAGALKTTVHLSASAKGCSGVKPCDIHPAVQSMSSELAASVPVYR